MLHDTHARRIAGSPARVPHPDDLLQLSDGEPVDMIAVAEDDLLVDAISAAGTAAALLAIDDPLAAMLLAWAKSAQPG